VSLESLLRNPAQPEQHCGFECALGLIIASSPAADEAVARFFHAGGEVLHSLLTW